MDKLPHACLPVDYSKEIQKLILENPDKWSQAVDEPTKLKWFVGQVMKNTGGKANPIFVIELLKIAADVVKKLR